MVEDIMKQVFLGNSIKNYLVYLSFVLAGFVAIKLFQSIILKRLNKLAKKTKTSPDDFAIDITRRILMPFGYFVVVYLSLNILKISELLKKNINTAAMAIITLFTARLMVIVIAYGFDVYSRKQGKATGFERSLSGILKVIKTLVWGMAIVFFLDNIGFKISAVIAGLGIGGIAVALAAQAVLKDLFSYFAILFDRPFEFAYPTQTLHITKETVK